MEKINNSDHQNMSSGKVIGMIYPEIVEQFKKISLLYLEHYKRREESISHFLSEEDEQAESQNPKRDGGEFTIIYRSKGLHYEDPSNH